MCACAECTWQVCEIASLLKSEPASPQGCPASTLPLALGLQVSYYTLLLRVVLMSKLRSLYLHSKHCIC